MNRFQHHKDPLIQHEQLPGMLDPSFLLHHSAHLICFAAAGHEVAAGAEPHKVLLVRMPAVLADCSLAPCIQQAQRAVCGG